MSSHGDALTNACGRGAQIDLLHLRVGLHLGHRAFGDHLPTCQHRHRCRECAHEIHVVFDDDDRAFTADAAQQVSGLLTFLGAHAGDRLVEQQHVGVLHQQHADLEPLLLTVRQHAGRFVGQVGQPDDLQAPPRSTATRRTAGAAASTSSGRPRRRCPDSAARVSCSKTLAVWNVRPDAESGDLVHLLAQQLHTGLVHRPGGGHQTGDRVDHSGLAGAVGADQEPQIALEQREVDIADGLEAVEIDG